VVSNGVEQDLGLFGRDEPADEQDRRAVGIESVLLAELVDTLVGHVVGVGIDPVGDDDDLLVGDVEAVGQPATFCGPEDEDPVDLVEDELGDRFVGRIEDPGQERGVWDVDAVDGHRDRGVVGQREDGFETREEPGAVEVIDVALVPLQMAIELDREGIAHDGERRLAVGHARPVGGVVGRREALVGRDRARGVAVGFQRGVEAGDVVLDPAERGVIEVRDLRDVHSETSTGHLMTVPPAARP